MSISKSLVLFIALLSCLSRPASVSVAGTRLPGEYPDRNDLTLLQDQAYPSAVPVSLLSSGPPQSPAPTGFKWLTATPESQGINRSKLEVMVDVLASRGTEALMIIRNDRVVTEWYAPGSSATQRRGVASAAKGLAGGMALLVALNDGLIGTEDFASKYIASWRTNSVKTKIQVKHLAAHTSGIEDADGPEPWKKAFWDRIPDPFSVAIKQAPVIFSPGSNMAYSNPGIAALDYALTASLKGTLQPDIRTTLQKRIMEPIGIPASEWSIGYETTYSLDGLKLQATWGGASYTARAAARIGRLLLRQGNWEGQQLVGSSWVTRMVGQVDSRFGSGLCWFNNAVGDWRALPRDAYSTAGSGHNLLLVVPSLNLIVVRFGTRLMDEQDFWLGLEQYLFEPLMEGMKWHMGNEEPRETLVKEDFTGDGKPDLLWRNSSTGDVTVWQMNGTSYASATIVGRVSDANWKITGIGDFTGDAQSDLVWQNQSNGQIGVWFMDGINLIRATNFNPGQVPDTAWRIVGTVDFNSDSKPDLVWQNQSNGEVGVWFMDGINRKSATNFSPGRVSDTAWKIVGTADFNSDSKPDLVWQNQSNGYIGVWFMDGINRKSATNFNPVRVPDLNWKIGNQQ